MGEEQVEKVLKSFGLTDKEAEVYVFLAKHGVLKGGQIAKQMRMHKAEAYRFLKSLQSKGLVESTLESPTRFKAVPFGTALDLFVKAKRDEAALIESAKKELLSDWEKISKSKPETPSERFVVIEGNNRIYPRIFQMIKETKCQLLSVSTVPGLVYATQFGLFDAMSEHPLRSNIQFRFLTEFTEENVSIVKNLLNGMPEIGVNLKGRTPDLGLQLSPRIVIRDDEEILFFTNTKSEDTPDPDQDVCLWTNCKALVQSFTHVFEELWNNSTDIYKKIAEVETGRTKPQIQVVLNAEKVKKRLDEALMAAKDVTILTSAEGLTELWKIQSIKHLTEKSGTSIKIMAPIVSKNFEFSQKLQKCCQVRHVSGSSMTAILVDGTHLFQFRNPESLRVKTEVVSPFESSFFTGDCEYLEKTKSILNSVWKNAHQFPAARLEASLKASAKPEDKPPYGAFLKSEYWKALGHLEELEEGTVTEKDIVSRMINAKRIIMKNPQDSVVQYGSYARTVIHPPSYFSLPDMIIFAFHCNKQSSFGAEDYIFVYLWLETPNGYAYVPVAHVTDNPKVIKWRKLVLAKTPAEQNVVLVKKDQLQVRVQGNSLFAGWTVPIRLYPSEYSLPPCCILFEGYGELKTRKEITSLPSGRTQAWEYNCFEAFVTFFHPSSKYSGPGTEGLFCRELILTGNLPPIK